MVTLPVMSVTREHLRSGTSYPALRRPRAASSAVLATWQSWWMGRMFATTSSPPWANGTTWSASVPPGWPQTWQMVSCLSSTYLARFCCRHPLSFVRSLRVLPSHGLRSWSGHGMMLGQEKCEQTFLARGKLGLNVYAVPLDEVQEDLNPSHTCLPVITNGYRNTCVIQ